MNRKEFWQKFDSTPSTEHFALHRKYYAQFVTPYIKAMLKHLTPRILNSTDRPYFNDIPLSTWDMLPKPNAIAQAVCAAQGGIAPSDWTCIYKEAALQIIEHTEAKHT